MSNQPPPPPPGNSWEPEKQSQPYEQTQPDEAAQTDNAEQQQGYGTPQHQPPTYDQGQQPYQSGAPQFQQGGQQPGGQKYAGQPGGTQGTMTESEEKTWSILAHLSAPVAALISVGTLNFVGPLIIWAIYKDKSPRVRHAAAGAFNFNLSLWIFYAVLFLLTVLTIGIGLIITVPLFLVVWVGSMVIHVMAAIKANNGEVYTYPFQIPVLK